VGVTFGTDGIRGVANVELTAEVALALGRAASAVLGAGTWLIGADTRASGPMLVAALAAGLASAGADVIDLGVLPTPGVAFHAQARGCPAAVVSASHNPWSDNGIKVLASGGRKLSDALEAAIAENMTAASPQPTGAVGRISRALDPAAPYVAHLVDALGGRRLTGMRVVLDCANGAASVVGPAALRAAGADVIVVGAEPNGTNINDACGSTHPSGLQDAVVVAGADAGLAFDGDADRVVAVAGDGAVVDGDHILAICAADLHQRGRLRGDRVALTVMSNLGLRLALADLGIGVVETPVGDRYVLEAMERDSLALGGEQSGHVIFSELATTGDGILTGLMLLDAVARSGRSLGAVAASAMTRLPQVLRNVRARSSRADSFWADVAGTPSVSAAVAAAEEELRGSGRVLLRPSGTEPLVRVMVEAPTEAQAVAVADRLCTVVEEALGAG
jgi:phosphoglucosamine mutase